MSITEIKLIIAALILAGASSLSAYTMHRVDQSHYLKLEMSIKDAHEKALQGALDKQQELENKAREASKQADINKQKLVQTTNQLSNQIQKYKNSKCITYGLIKIINIAAVNKPIIETPTNKTDLDCAPVSSFMLSESVVKNYGLSIQNTKQLNELIDYLQDMQQHFYKK